LPSGIRLEDWWSKPLENEKAHILFITTKVTTTITFSNININSGRRIGDTCGLTQFETKPNIG